MKLLRASGVFLLPLNIHDLQTVRPSTRLAKCKSWIFGLIIMIRRQHINREKILERDLYICAYCLSTANEVDHVVPWSWSHNNDEDNLVASCRDCNGIAGGRMFSSFDEKRAYILIIRSGLKWTKKLAIKYQVFRCSNCKVIFAPLKNGATNFLCPICTNKEYSE